MAQLQGHLLRYKNDPEGAIRGISQLAASENLKHRPAGASSSNSESSGDKKVSNAMAGGAKRGRRVLTVEEVDKMYFNPQPGWDKDVPNI